MPGDTGPKLERWWRQFCDLDDMFPSQRWARAYLLGLGGYWGGFALMWFLSRGDGREVPWIVGVAVFACGAIPIATWFRWMWLHRRSLSGLLIAYLAGLNFPGQFSGAFRVGRWDWRKGTTVLLALLLVDFVLLQVFVAT